MNTSDQQYRDLANGIALVADAVANGTIAEGGYYLAVRRLEQNVEMLKAWTPDDRPFGENRKEHQ